jgi:hypothetical protein
MRIAEAPGAAQALRQKLGRSQDYYQETFRTPSRQARLVTTTVLATHTQLDAGSVTIEHVVFTPKNLEALLGDNDLPLTYGRDTIITASGAKESEALLEAAWSDWLDFYFVPVPSTFQLFADHDEYTTFFAATKGHLARIVTALSAASFPRVGGYRREW